MEAAWWSESLEALTPYRRPRFQVLVLGGFGALALGLTGLGNFSVVAVLVAARRREMGIRLAIGATPRSLVQLMLRQTLTPVVVGLAAGLVLTHWAGRLAEAYLSGVEARDPIALAAAALTVLGTALLAAFLPARHAARVDPMLVLRQE